jgi:hypothetical protein
MFSLSYPLPPVYPYNRLISGLIYLRNQILSAAKEKSLKVVGTRPDSRLAFFTGLKKVSKERTAVWFINIGNTSVQVHR